MMTPLFVGMFHRQIDGDHHLLELLQQVFTEIELGAEFYPVSAEDLQSALEFRPLSQPFYTVHLPRSYHLLNPDHRQSIMAFANRARLHKYGLIIHDYQDMATKYGDYVSAANEVNELLLQEKFSPRLFIEYAVGIELDRFVGFFEEIIECEKVSVCIDIGHVGSKLVRDFYSVIRSIDEFRELSLEHPQILERVDDINTSLSMAMAGVIDFIKALAVLNKPIHFHLHDAHPLSNVSPYGVPDHLGFFHKLDIPLPSGDYQTLPLLYGPKGLESVVQTSLELLPLELLSFSLEIHPDYTRKELGVYEDLFQGWIDKKGAEQTYAWVDTIAQNFKFLKKVVTSILNNNGE